VAGAQHREEPAIADQAVDDNDGGDEEQQELNDSTVARRPFDCRVTTPRCRFAGDFLWHAKKQYTNSRESTRAMTGECILVLTTMPADDRAAALARTLVDERLAACVNVHAPMSSTYRWQGQVEVESERQVVIKTTTAKLAALESRLRALHPYELPEFVVLDGAASDAYAAWATDAVESDSAIGK
jgi:periplasmic divalent cation tolerance protein